MDIQRQTVALPSREIFIHIGTLMFVMLIALGVGKAIETLHWYEVVSEEREALRDESGRLRNTMISRFELEPCFIGRLAEVKEIIRRHDSNKPIEMAEPLGSPPFLPAPRPRWELAVANQSLTLMKLPEKRRFIDAYNSMFVYDQIAGDEREAWVQLQALNHADQLTSADWFKMREAYKHAEESRAIIASGTNKWLGPFDALLREKPKVSVRHGNQVEDFCKPMLTNDAAGRRSAGASHF